MFTFSSDCSILLDSMLSGLEEAMQPRQRLICFGAITAIAFSFASHQTIAQERTNGPQGSPVANRFIARVQLLNDEARRFELNGDLKAAYELATRADSILATVFRRSNAKWPKNEETPAELISRLRYKARKIQAAQAKRAQLQQAPNQTTRTANQSARAASQTNQARIEIPRNSTARPQLTNARPQQENTRPQPSPFATQRGVSVTPGSTPKIAAEPRLLLEQLDRAETTWQSIEEPQTTVTKPTAKPAKQRAKSSGTARVDAFANRTPLYSDPDVQPLGTQSGQPHLLMPRDAGNQLSANQTVATIPTEASGSVQTPNGKRPWNYSSLKKETAEQGNVFVTEFPSEPVVADSLTAPVVPPPFELEVAESKRLGQISETNLDSENGDTNAAGLEPNTLGDFSVAKSDAKLTAEHAHAEGVMLWVLAGVGLTLAVFWACRLLLQFLFDVRMGISFHGRAQPATSRLALSQATTETQAEAIPDPNGDAPIAVNNDSLAAFPFRLVGGAHVEHQSEQSAAEAAAKQKLLRTAVEENLLLQANDRRDAA